MEQTVTACECFEEDTWDLSSKGCQVSSELLTNTAFDVENMMEAINGFYLREECLQSGEPRKAEFFVDKFEQLSIGGSEQVGWQPLNLLKKVGIERRQNTSFRDEAGTPRRARSKHNDGRLVAFYPEAWDPHSILPADLYWYTKKG
jgi:hypothetical protein